MVLEVTGEEPHHFSVSTLYDQVKVKRIGLKRSPLFRELYFVVLKTTWPKFLLAVAMSYILMNGVFAGLYWMQEGSITNATRGSYFDAFVFSIQTSGTIGYGYFLPATTYAHLIVIAENIFGTLFVAVVTGLTFAKFSRPNVRVIFSRRAILMTYEGVPTLMFRIGNGRDSYISDARLHVAAITPQESSEGVKMFRFVDLHLERAHSPFFALTWTVIHKITAASPLHGLSPQTLDDRNIDIFVTLSGWDDVLAQTITVSHRYQGRNLTFGRKFKDVINRLEDDTREIDFTVFDEIEA